jgi:pilus assembly protein Flp/PilA
MRKIFYNFAMDDKGATAIEYGFIASGIGLVILLAVQTIGISIDLSYSSIATNF